MTAIKKTAAILEDIAANDQSEQAAEVQQPTAENEEEQNLERAQERQASQASQDQEVEVAQGASGAQVDDDSPAERHPVGEDRPTSRPVSLRNPYYRYKNPMALIDHCYHTWRIKEGQWHRDAFYEKILHSKWILTLNDVYAMARLEPDFIHLLAVVRELIFMLKVRDTKYIDGRFQGDEFNRYELEALLSAVALNKASSREELEGFETLIRRLPGPINLKRVKRRALRVGVTDIDSAMTAFKSGSISAFTARSFCFAFELDPEHEDYNDAFARSTKIPA